MTPLPGNSGAEATGSSFVLSRALMKVSCTHQDTAETNSMQVVVHRQDLRSCLTPVDIDSFG